MGEMKKGVLFTLGMTLLVMSVFVLSVMIYRGYQFSAERTADMLMVERTADIFSSVSSSFSKHYYNASTVRISANGTRLIFYPFNLKLNAFQSKSSELEGYVEQAYPEVEISRSFTPSDFKFFVTNKSGAEITNITLDYINENKSTATLNTLASRVVIYYYSSVNNGTVQWTGTTAGALNVTIVAEGTGNWRSEAGRMVDPQALSAGRITGLAGWFNFTFNTNQAEIYSNDSDLSNAYMSIYYSMMDVDIDIPVTITANFTDKVIKSDSVRVM